MMGRQEAGGLVTAEAVWTVRTRPTGRGDMPWTVAARKRNIHTSYGLTALASAFGGVFAAPQYLVIENPPGAIAPANSVAAGVTSVVLTTSVHQPGDTSIVLSMQQPGTNQEVVSFSSAVVNADTTVTYTLTAATTKPHTAGDLCCRNVSINDMMSNVLSEVQYDAVAAPAQRMKTMGGFSPGTGAWTQQFFYTGLQALTTFVLVGLADSPTVGAGNLHNHLVLGYVHASGNDAQIDITLTLTN